jgi:hypothetical protein
MNGFMQMVSALREQMHATLSRSDVLRPLAWLIGILLTATVAALFAKPPEWLLIVMASLLVGAIVLYGIAYGFCLLKDRDALRSEKYSLHKMAMEHGLLGDSTTGMFEADEVVKSEPEPRRFGRKRVAQQIDPKK